ncbi:MAG: hypothetical protein NXY57DRAFT_905660, partial [Lentinula lateritia]
KYIGVHHQTGQGSIYKDNYQMLADKAKNAAGAVLHAKTFVGSDMPIKDMITMYWARVDPYLKNGSEFIMDVVVSHREQLEEVQHYFLRRALSIQKRSSLEVLFTETGVMPIQYRWIILFFKNMQYLISLPHHHLAWKAMREAYSLAQKGHTSIILEACRVLESLPIPVTWNIPEFEDITTAHLNDLIVHIQDSMERTLQNALMTCPRTTDTLKDRKEYDRKNKKMVFKALAFRHYLKVPTGKHRKALIQMVTGNHQLAVERLRWNERNRPRIIREHRICRICKCSVEDPAHVLFECKGSTELIKLRDSFMQKVISELPQYAKSYSNAWMLFRILLAETRITELFAKLAYDVLEVVYNTEMFVPA